MPATISHVLSATTPDNTSYEIRPSHWNSNHLATLNAVGSEVSGAFANGGGVTFGYDGTNITAAAPAGAPSPVNFSAGTTSNNLASVVFANGSGVLFGLSGSTITASVKTDYQTSGAYLTTAMRSDAVTLSNINFSAGTTSSNLSALTFSNSNGLAFGLGTGANVGVVTGSYTVPTVTNSSWTVSDSATSGSVARLAFTNLNGMTLSLSTGAGGSHTIVGSYTVPAVTTANYAGTGTSFGGTNISGSMTLNTTGLTLSLSVAAPGAGGGAAVSIGGNSTSAGAGYSNITSGTAVLMGGNNITLSQNGASITISGANVGGAQTGISGIVVSDATYTSGTVSFSNAGNITISSSVNGATQYIKLSGNAAQTTQSAIKAFGVSNTGQTAGNTGVSTGIDWVIAGSQSITMSQSTAAGGPNTVWVQHPAWITTYAAQTNQTANLYVSANSTQLSSTAGVDVRTLSFAGAGIISMGVSQGVVLASATQSNQTGNLYVTANSTQLSSTAGIDHRSLSFAGAGIVSMGVSQGVVVASATQSSQPAIKGLGVSNTGNTLGNTGTFTGVDWAFAASGAITASGSTTNATGPHTLWMSVATQTNQTGNFYVTANSTQLSSTAGIDHRSLSFAGAGIVSMGVSQGVVVASATQSNQTGNLYVTANSTQLSSTAGIDHRSLSFAGAGIISMGVSGGVVVASATQSAQTANLYVSANSTQLSSTAGVDVRTLSFAGAGGVSMGVSQGVVLASAPATSSLSATGIVSISTNGSTISIGVASTNLSVWEPFPLLTGSAYSSHAPASWWFNRFVIDDNVIISNINVIKSLSCSAPGAASQASTGTERFSYSHGVTIFSRQDLAANSSNLTTVKTASWGFTAGLTYNNASQNSLIISYVTNTTGGTTSTNTTSNGSNWSNWLMGQRLVAIPCVATLAPGEYWLAHAHSSTTGTTNSNVTLVSVSNLHIAPQNLGGVAMFGTSGTQASLPVWNGGLASAITTNNSMALSVVSASATQNNWYVAFQNF